jgi:hypothetical protein
MLGAGKLTYHRSFWESRAAKLQEAPVRIASSTAGNILLSIQ